MGKIMYEPKKENEEQEVVTNLKDNDETKVGTRYEALVESIESVRPVGDTQCEYGVYLEDYVYTYIYQYAATDLRCEHSGILVGEYYTDTKETIICGMIPISRHKLSEDAEWINEEVIQDLMEQKEKHFPGTKVLGWFHMQPGYGTMLTMKEVKIHRELFDHTGSLLLLVDPINKIEAFFAYEDGTLKEQAGYFLYYDKNPGMQQYMLDNPFSIIDKEGIDDTAVHQFREIGKIRKKEYQQRKRTNFTVIAASIAILALGAVVIKMSDQNKQISQLQGQLQGQAVQAHSEEAEAAGEEKVQFIISDPQTEEDDSNKVSLEEEITQNTEVASGEGVKVVDNTKVDLTPNQKPQEETVVEDEVISEESTKVVKEQEIKEVVENETKAVEEKEPVVPAKEVEDKEEGYIKYTVQEGDTLRKISFDHYQTEKRAKEIITFNDLEDGDQIYVGQTLKIPEK